MAQVKIYGLKATFDKKRELISSAVHSAVVSAFQYPVEKKFQRFIALAAEDFIYPDDRSENYIIIEISIFEGRSNEAKKSLIKQLCANIAQSAGIATQDIEITLFETPKQNWGIRGMPGDELALSYKIEV